MTLAKLRAAVKDVEPTATVSKSRDWEDLVVVRTRYKLDEVVAVIDACGFKEGCARQISGSRWNWIHVLTLEVK